ncbi:MAG: uroporphyrinogen decarboxylase family protein [Deltaproteobacteria bacterium]|nr:uroporphyrinogen decarboxylase family protein [Deltaproteobacteria bacterium]
MRYRGGGHQYRREGGHEAGRGNRPREGVKVFGNVATATTLFNGTPEEVYQEATQALENGTDFLCPGCGVAPPTPLENLLQIKKARDDFFN